MCARSSRPESDVKEAHHDLDRLQHIHSLYTSLTVASINLLTAEGEDMSYNSSHPQSCSDTGLHLPSVHRVAAPTAANRLQDPVWRKHALTVCHSLRFR